MSSITRKPALFLDRDGVINEDVGYLYRPADCVLVQGAASLIRTANQLGYLTCVVTNQSGIGRGMYSEEEFHSLMAHMRQVLLAEGASLDLVYFSPFHPVHGVGKYKRDSPCRKPAPGMLLQAATENGIDLRRSFMVGDRLSDLEAGQAAGVPNLLLFGTTSTGSDVVPFQYTLVDTLFSVEQALGATFALSLG